MFSRMIGTLYMQVNIVGRGLNRNETRDIIGHGGESSHEIGSGMLIRHFELDP